MQLSPILGPEAQRYVQRHFWWVDFSVLCIYILIFYSLHILQIYKIKDCVSKGESKSIIVQNKLLFIDFDKSWLSSNPLSTVATHLIQLVLARTWRILINTLVSHTLTVLLTHSLISYLFFFNSLSFFSTCYLYSLIILDRNNSLV